LADFINSTNHRSIILFLGDFDPSGLDLERDYSHKLALFGAKTEFKRIGITQEQIKKYKLPSYAIKKTDSRHDEYQKLYGSKGWELDALSPKILIESIETEVLKLRDDKAYQDKLLEWHQGREQLKKQICDCRIPIDCRYPIR
jgi:hypothetical protein